MLAEATLQLVRGALPRPAPELPRIALPIERRLLSKRRWRGQAADGREFGFDLERPLTDGAAVHVTDDAVYVLELLPEPVLDIPLSTTPAEAARLGWLLGNLHFALEVQSHCVRVADDPAVRQVLARHGLGFTAHLAVFHPLAGGHSHGV